MTHVSILESIGVLEPESWNRLVEKNNPFIRHEFYQALESSKCIGASQGWQPLYFCAFESEQLRAVAVVFVKTDSFGEFIFDWAWAQAYERHQIPYYPKLTLATPFSPVSAPKLLGDQEVISRELLPKIWELYQQTPVSGLHALFIPGYERQYFANLRMLERDSFQYHWERGATQSFESFLATLKRSRRKNILKERRRVREQGIVVKKIFGPKLQQEDVDFFFECYMSTVAKKFSNAYLNREFFRKITTLLAEHIVLVVAEHSGERVASALYLKSEEALYGRYWGCLRHFDFLHFELCLYQGLELCYELNLSFFEAGAQGEHKRMRGFRPVLTRSFHHLKHPQFHAAVQDFIQEERGQIDLLFQEFEKQNPFKAEL